jgi:prenyltransferase beta subunit
VLCQTYEGGFGATPGVEGISSLSYQNQVFHSVKHYCCVAHGGYTFCGVASLKLLGKDNLFDVENLLVRIFFDLLLCHDNG